MKYLAVIFLFLLAGQSFSQRLDTIQTPQINGIKQYIRLKANDRKSPILLFLHGGPGNSVLNYADKFSSSLYDHFIVVHWDQRETGKTLQLNPSDQALKFSVFQEDARQLIQHLLIQFKREKIYLMAHSWGTAIGFQLVKTNPELFCNHPVNYIFRSSLYCDSFEEKSKLWRIRLNNS